MGDEVCPLNSCRTPWFRQRSTWWLKITRSSLSWVSWQTGQMRVRLLSSHDCGCCKVTVFMSLLITKVFWTESSMRLCWFFQRASLFDTETSLSFSSSITQSLLHFSNSSRSFCTSRSESESETVCWFGLREEWWRHWSICVLKVFKSVVSTLLKHTGQVRLSDDVPPQPDVDARASDGETQPFSNKSEAVEIFSCAFLGDSPTFWVEVYVEVITGASWACSSSCLFAFPVWILSLLAWAIWKKDCLGSLLFRLPSNTLFLVHTGSSCCRLHFCTKGGQGKGWVWREWTGTGFSSNFWSISLVELLECTFPGWRNPRMLFCWGFLSSELTNVEILTP